MQKLVRIPIAAVVTTLILTLSAKAIDAGKFVVTRGTEHKVGMMIGVGGEEMCFRVENLYTGNLAWARFRASINGHPRNLDVHFGGRCLTSRAGTFVVYITALDEDIRVFASSKATGSKYDVDLNNLREKRRPK